MDRFEAMRIFVAVAEDRSFVGAARRLDLSAPAVTRAIAGLEERLGVALFQRTTRVVRTTQAGASYYADAKRLLGDVQEADARAAGVHTGERGSLTVTAPLLFGRLHVAPVVLEFLAGHPDVSARTLFVDHLVDILEEGVDVAVRIGALEESSLHAVRVGEVRPVVCGSPAYLEKHGTPLHVADLAAHTLIGFVGINPHRHWAFMEKGKRVSFNPRPRLVVNTADVAADAAKAGAGLTRLLSYQAADALRAGTLKRVLASLEPAPLPVHVVYAGGRRAPARVRAFVAMITERLRALALA